MNLVVQKNKIVFVGKVGDIINIFTSYPGETTLLEFIRLNLN
ncbi:MAG TPA: hypothetical protein VFC73_09675 [Syntrophomonadaceae bacterium]|nr:hypothetical protein [Syntrophomonadaceae bacterium]